MITVDCTDAGRSTRMILTPFAGFTGLATAGSDGAGTFQPQNGDAVIRATYALPADALKALAVTEEPAGGVPQPTGSFALLGMM